MTVPGWREPGIPVDPWPEAPTSWAPRHDVTLQMPSPPTAQARPKGEVYGRVYELVLVGQPADQCTYIGKTVQTLHQRVHASRNAHTSAAGIAKDPWKANVAPGLAGYRQLEVVYTTGEGKAADEAALRRAEADWIDRRRPVYNDVRPVRPRHGETVPKPPRQPRPTPRVRLSPREQRAQSRARRRTSLFLLLLGTLMTAVSVLLYRVEAASGTDWPAPVIWILAPSLSALAAWWLFHTLDGMSRKVTGRRKR